MRRPPPVAALALGLAVFLSASGCASLPGTLGRDDGDLPSLGSRSLDRSAERSSAPSPPEAAPAPLPLDAADLSFEPGPCGFEIPAGPEPRCGVVVVPADWSSVGGDVVSLAVAVFPSTADDPAPDPVVYLDGGPGSHSLETVGYSVDDLLDPLRARGEVVLFDQRGAGRSRPRLHCPETEAVDRELESRPHVDDEEEQARFETALQACRARLVAEGNDLGDYNSVNNAHDVEAIRLALGYDRWNLYGISYGTRLGLEVLRHHPGGVRSAVLDSVFPPQVDSTRDNPATFVASWRKVVEACRAEPACAAEGDLEERVRVVVRRYDAEPMEVEVDDWIADEQSRVYVDGDTIVGIVVGALYSPFRFGDLPELVAELEDGRTGAVSDFLSQERSNEHFFSDGMFYALVCQDEISFADPAEVARAVPPDPFGARERFEFGTNVGTNAFRTCEAFGTGRAPPESNQPVHSDVPVLLFGGELDPVTPAEWAREAAATLPNSYLIVAPRAAHGVSTDGCGMSIVVAFLGDPSAAPDGGCLDEAELTFLAARPTEAVLESDERQEEEVGLTISTVRPADWMVGSLGGDQYRQDSFLDPTQLYQLAGDDGLRQALAAFIEDQHDLSLSPARPFGDGDSIGSLAGTDLGPGWSRRSGRNEAVGVEWFETEMDGVAGMVVLVAAADEIDDLIDRVLAPAVQGFGISRG